MWENWNMKTELIRDGESLVSARFKSSGTEIPVYDDGFGPLYIHRDSMGVSGIVRAQTWEDAYSICEDEFFPEATETLEEIVKEYGFRREHKKVVDDSGQFVRWETVETPDPDAWIENALFCEAFGFRSSGPNVTDTLNHGIYAKDLNGDFLDRLTRKLLDQLGIELTIETNEEID
jgi:hypothetical protein